MDGVFARLEKGYGCVRVDIAFAPARVVGSAFAHLRSELDSMRASESEPPTVVSWVETCRCKTASPGRRSRLEIRVTT